MKTWKILLFWAIVMSALGFKAIAQEEITAANSKGWLQFHEENGIKLFRAHKEESGLIPFRAYGIFEGKIEDYLKVLLNHKEKPNWAPKLKEVKVHRRISSNQFIFSEYYKTPWPATDREFLLKGHVQFVAPGHIRLVAENAQETELKRKDHILCNVLLLNLDLKKISSNKTAITFEFYGDMMGWMPIWLINIIQKKWPMRFLQGLSSYVKEGRAVVTKEYLSLER